MPSAADRIGFWTKLHQRFDALSNRVDAAQRGAILTAIHARIPMPTLDDQQATQLERAHEDALFWQSMADTVTDDIEAHKGLLATTQRTIAGREKAAADFATNAQAATERLVREEKSEAVAGIPAPMTHKDFLRIRGMTEAGARHCVRVAEIADFQGHDEIAEVTVVTAAPEPPLDQRQRVARSTTVDHSSEPIESHGAATALPAMRRWRLI